MAAVRCSSLLSLSLSLSSSREHYYPECEGIIFVIDSAEPVRMCVVKDELDTLLSHKDMAKNLCPILFFANKSDLPKALTPQQIAEALELTKLVDRKYNIMSAANQTISHRTHARDPRRSWLDTRRAAEEMEPHMLTSLLLPFSLLAPPPSRASNALTGSGLEAGVKWLSGNLPK